MIRCPQIFKNRVESVKVQYDYLLWTVLVHCSKSNLKTNSNTWSEAITSVPRPEKSWVEVIHDNLNLVWFPAWPKQSSLDEIAFEINAECNTLAILISCIDDLDLLKI